MARLDIGGASNEQRRPELTSSWKTEGRSSCLCPYLAWLRVLPGGCVHMSQPKYILVWRCLGVGRAWHRLAAPPAFAPFPEWGPFLHLCWAGTSPWPLEWGKSSCFVFHLVTASEHQQGTGCSCSAWGPSISYLNVSLLKKGVQGKQFTDTVDRILRLETDLTDLWSRTRYIKTQPWCSQAGALGWCHQRNLPWKPSEVSSWSFFTRCMGFHKDLATRALPEARHKLCLAESVGERYVGCRKGPCKTAFQENCWVPSGEDLYTTKSLHACDRNINAQAWIK